MASDELAHRLEAAEQSMLELEQAMFEHIQQQPNALMFIGKPRNPLCPAPIEHLIHLYAANPEKYPPALDPEHVVVRAAGEHVRKYGPKMSKP